MKKIFKKSNIFSFIFGLIVMACIGVVYAINADQIEYGTGTLEDALDELYSKSDEKIIMNTFGETQYSASYGNATTSQTGSLTLDKGKYLIVVGKGDAYNASASTGTTGKSLSDVVIDCSDNCSSITALYGYYNIVKGTSSAVTTTTTFSSAFAYSYLYYIEVLNDNSVITATHNYAGTVEKNRVGSYIVLAAVPIN